VYQYGLWFRDTHLGGSDTGKVVQLDRIDALSALRLHPESEGQDIHANNKGSIHCKDDGS
jgi:hypothetical protein